MEVRCDEEGVLQWKTQVKHGKLMDSYGFIALFADMK